MYLVKEITYLMFQLCQKISDIALDSGLRGFVYYMHMMCFLNTQSIVRHHETQELTARKKYKARNKKNKKTQASIMCPLNDFMVTNF